MIRNQAFLRRLDAARRARDEGGWALLVVLGIGIVMMMVVATALGVTQNGLQRTATDQNWTSAYSAATAGLNDYKARLSSASDYVKYGNPNDPYSAGSPGMVLPTGSLANPAFGINAGGTWATVSGSSNKAYFRYSVNTSDYSARGVIHVKATGMVGTNTRSIIADFRKKGFFDFVYFTQYEVQDPTVLNAGANAAACARYAWSTPPRTGCTTVQFAGADVLNGDIFSNDQFTSCSATFLGSVTSAAPSTYAPVKEVCNPASTYGTTKNAITGGSNPANSSSMLLPPTAAALRQEATADAWTGSGPGCMYTGPTSITFNDNGTMTVISPFTKVTRPNSSGVGGSSPAECGIIGTGTGGLGTAGGSTVPVPADNVIYVQPVPVSTTDPNYPNMTVNTTNTTFSSGGSQFTCFTSNSGVNGWRLKTGGTTIQYPATNETTVPSPAQSQAYNCNAGDVYIQGKLLGHVTVAADRFAYVTGDITYAAAKPVGSSYNVLGLVATKAIIVWNPMSGQNAILPKNRTIYGALLALQGTIMVQNYNTGNDDRGTLTIWGSLAQNFRGTVATGGANISTGYAKNYNYDQNLKYNAPPKYLAPANISYGVSQVASVPAAWNADGSART